MVHLSPLGSQVSFTTVNTTRIENVADWDAISKKYRALVGGDADDSGSMRDSEVETASQGTEAAAPVPVSIGNNVNMNTNAIGQNQV